MDTRFILGFLSDLKVNNNREWFEQNRDRYKQANAHFIELVAIILEDLIKLDPDLDTLDPKKCVFRIYRDVRFSKDKTPYKTGLGASMRPAGRKSGLAGYYLFIQPGNNSLAAGGLWQPNKERLEKIRQEIDYSPDRIVKLLCSKEFKETFGQLRGEALKRAPKGYSEDHENIDLLRHKDFIVYHYFNDTEVRNKDFVAGALRCYKTMKPFNDYFNTAILG